MRAEIVTLTEAETRQYRLLAVKLDALMANPTAYSGLETEEIIRRKHTFWQEVTDKYELGCIKTYSVDWTTGSLIATDE